MEGAKGPGLGTMLVGALLMEKIHPPNLIWEIFFEMICVCVFFFAGGLRKKTM